MNKHTSDARTARNHISGCKHKEITESPLEEQHRGISFYLVEAAVNQIKNLNLTGLQLQEKIKEVSDDMELEPEEIDQLKVQLTGPEFPVVPNNDTMDNMIWFDSEEDWNQAVGMLMYKAVAWSSKGELNGKFFIELPDKETLLSAHETIKRRWDFVDSVKRVVGLIQFDNLKDYSKVLDFILKSNMVVEFGEVQSSFGEDYDIEASISSGEKTEAVMDTKDGSYSAKNKTIQQDLEPEPEVNPLDRTAFVRKVWK